MLEHTEGSIVSGFHAVVGLWVWTMVVLLHAAWRSFFAPSPDPIRETGPIR